MAKSHGNDDTIRSKLALLQLAEELNSVTKACSIMGYSRDSYYRFKKLYDTGGKLALKNLDRRKPMHKNRVSEDIEKQVVEIALDYPNYGQEKAAKLLQGRKVSISASGVRAVWKRHDLESKTKRLKALHAKVEQEERELTEEQRKHIEQLHALKQDQSELDTSYPGNIAVQDTLYIGNISRVGEVYQQTFIDSYSKFTIVHLYSEKTVNSSIDMLDKHILPWLKKMNLNLEQMLTDRGAEFYGHSNDGDKYQRLLKHLNIEHIKMRAYNSPEVNGICARFHKVQQTGFYEPLLHSQRFYNLQELESELQKWVNVYNSETPHQERYCFGKTPMETLLNSIHLAKNNENTTTCN